MKKIGYAWIITLVVLLVACGWGEGEFDGLTITPITPEEALNEATTAESGDPMFGITINMEDVRRTREWSSRQLGGTTISDECSPPDWRDRKVPCQNPSHVHGVSLDWMDEATEREDKHMTEIPQNSKERPFLYKCWGGGEFDRNSERHYQREPEFRENLLCRVCAFNGHMTGMAYLGEDEPTEEEETQ